MTLQIVTVGQENKLIYQEIYKKHEIYLTQSIGLLDQKDIINGYTEVKSTDLHSNYLLDVNNFGYSCDINPDISYLGKIAIDADKLCNTYIGITSINFSFATDKKQACIDNIHYLIDSFLS